MSDFQIKDLPERTQSFWKIAGPGAVLVGLSIGAGEIIIWPSIVAEVQLTHGGGNEIARLPVTMQYKMWKSGIVTGNVNGRSTGPPSQGRTGQGL